MAISPLLTLFKEQLENESKALAATCNLEKRGDFLIYWYFMKLHNLNPAEVEEIICDDGSDLGIDAIRIDENDYVHFYQFKNPEKIEAGFPGGDVDKVISGLHLILARQHNKVANESLRQMIDGIYQTIPTGYRLHLVTSGSGLSMESITKLKTFVQGLGGPTDDFFTFSIEELKALQDEFYQKTLPTVTEPIVFDLERQPPYQIRSANHDSYIFHAKGTILGDLYQLHGEQLLQQNIRVFQGEKTTNANIRQTCSGEESANFFHFNNGVTFLCESAQWDQFVGKLILHHAQVVNGGQTIRVLASAKAEGVLKEDVILPVRIITSQGDKDFAGNVAVNLNNQNRVESSFLKSNNPRIIQLANSLASIGWYLERRQDELTFLNETEKKTIEQKIGRSLNGRVIALKEGTQAYVTTYFRQPELAKKNPQKMFLGVSEGGYFEKIFGEQISADQFVNAHQLKNLVENFVERFGAVKRRKPRLASWEQEYTKVLGSKIVSNFGTIVDQVVPQCSVFLTAMIFEEYVRQKKERIEDIIDKLSSGEIKLLQESLYLMLNFAKENPSIANKSWPTLLKSQSFFENLAIYLKGATMRLEK